MIDAELNHDILIANTRPKLSFDERKNYDVWRTQIKRKFCALTGLDLIAKNACPLNIQIEWEREEESYTITRFTFESEVGETVPCYLLVPKTGKEKYPVAITLQGHSSGFHLSIGEIRYDGDEKQQPRASFALQAVERGYIALAIEQRGMGERKTHTHNRHPMYNCRYASLIALELGRTILGERIWDVHRAIDALAYFPQCDCDKILITGNSGGGTTSYYAACYDERIKLSVPSCSFSPYKPSILSIAHCPCNYIPSAYRYFDMQDLACLLAPRSLAVITGEKDEIFPIEGVRNGFERVRKIYEKGGGACRIVETPMGHWWCEDLVWDTVQEEVEKLRW